MIPGSAPSPVLSSYQRDGYDHQRRQPGCLSTERSAAFRPTLAGGLANATGTRATPVPPSVLLAVRTPRATVNRPGVTGSLSVDNFESPPLRRNGHRRRGGPCRAPGQDRSVGILSIAPSFFPGP